MSRSSRNRRSKFRQPAPRDRAFVVTAPLPGASDDGFCDCPICAWLDAQDKAQDEIAPGVFAAPLNDAEVLELQAVFATMSNAED